MATEPQPEQRRGGALRWILGAILVFILLGVLAVGAWYLFRSEDVVGQDLETDIEQVVIEVEGEVNITVGDAFRVDAQRAWLFSGPPAVEISVDGGILRVHSDCGSGFNFLCAVSIDAVVPADAEILVDTSAGSITVTGTNGGADLSTEAGSITVDVTGPATLRTSAGSIEGTVRDGNVDAATSAGNVELTIEGEFDAVSAVTSAGSVELLVPDEVYAVDASTSAGDVTLDVRTDPDSELTIHARSSAGDVAIRSG